MEDLSADKQFVSNKNMNALCNHVLRMMIRNDVTYHQGQRCSTDNVMHPPQFVICNMGSTLYQVLVQKSLV